MRLFWEAAASYLLAYALMAPVVLDLPWYRIPLLSLPGGLFIARFIRKPDMARALLFVLLCPTATLQLLLKEELAQALAAGNVCLSLMLLSALVFLLAALPGKYSSALAAVAVRSRIVITARFRGRFAADLLLIISLRSATSSFCLPKDTSDVGNLKSAKVVRSIRPACFMH